MAFGLFSEKIVSPKHLANLHKKSDTGRALSAAALVDTILADAIKSKMVKISKDVNDRIFGGTGPLSNFSSKIDIAYSLGIIDLQMRKQLHKIRTIRNAFAHTMDDYDFETEEIVGLCNKLQPISKNLTGEVKYFATIVAVCRHIIPVPHPESAEQPSSRGILGLMSLPRSPARDQKKKED